MLYTNPKKCNDSGTW